MRRALPLLLGLLGSFASGCTDSVADPGSAGCTLDCDCPQGDACIDGACAATTEPVYCCENAGCPSGERCVDIAGAVSVCAGCRGPCDCPQGSACSAAGECVETSAPSYCCDTEGCPDGDACVQADGTENVCGEPLIDGGISTLDAGIGERDGGAEPDGGIDPDGGAGPDGGADPDGGAATDGGVDAATETDAMVPPDECEALLGVRCDEFREAYIKADTPRSGAGFGRGVALSADTLVVGSTRIANNDAGEVHIFVDGPGGWRAQAIVRAPGDPGVDEFGASVAIDGDTIVVGAQRADDPADGTPKGAAYVFLRSGSTWSQQAVLRASNRDTHDFFGGSVTISGDTIAVGAQNESSASVFTPDDNSLVDAGAVYLFTRSGTRWSQQSIIKPNTPASFARFGTVAMAGDRLLIGAEGENAAYLFERAGGVWSRSVTFTAPGGLFGGAVALSGDTVVIGAWANDEAYVFRRSGGTWMQEARLRATHGDDDDWFGQAVAIDGDLLLVGAPQEDGNGRDLAGDETNNDLSNSGAGFLFRRTGSSWRQVAYIKASHPGVDDRLGWGESIAVHGDRVAIGAWGEASGSGGVNGDELDDSRPRAGALYVRRVAP